MNQETDIAILGSGFRGLWLGSELVKLGWKVSFFQIHKPTEPAKKERFRFDDWAWQVGPQIKKSHLLSTLKEFIEEVIRPKDQGLAVQILTPRGPLELSGPARNQTLDYFFPKSAGELKAFIDGAKESDKKLFAAAQRIFKKPLGRRWVLDWLGPLRRSRAVGGLEWIQDWDGELLDPTDRFWLLNDSLSQVSERALGWAEKKGVKVYSGVRITDLGIEGHLATGLEVAGGGFLKCRRVILACAYQTAIKAVPRLHGHIEPQIKKDTEKYVWSRCGFLLKKGTKPEGLCEFSSFVIDPYMPLEGANAGLLKWWVGELGDSLTVWSRIPFGELRRRSYLMNLAENLESNMGQLFPWFKSRVVAVFPFEEYFHSPEAHAEDLTLVYDRSNDFRPAKSKLKNVMSLDPGIDRGLELLSQLASESRCLGLLTEIRTKELKRDRTLHSSRNGKDMGPPKQI